MSSASHNRSLKIPLWGDGSDGDVTISSNVNLTRAMFYTYLTVDSGFTLSGQNYPIYVNALLDNQGTISYAGNKGTDAVTSSAGVGGAGLAHETATGDSGQGGAKATTGVGSNTGVISVTQNGLGGSGAATSGAGGNGTAGAGGSGGAGRTITATQIRFATGHLLRGASLLYAGGAGNGGGSGAGDAGANSGGAGGGGGGAGGNALILARGINNAGVITVAGGNGGAGGSPIVGVCGGGGGGGAGGGGFATLICNTLHALGTITTSGGTGGGKGTGNGGGGNGTNGNDGSAGGYRVIYVKD